MALKRDGIPFTRPLSDYCTQEMTAKLIRPRFDINMLDDKENRLIIYTQVVSDQLTIE